MCSVLEAACKCFLNSHSTDGLLIESSFDHSVMKRLKLQRNKIGRMKWLVLVKMYSSLLKVFWSCPRSLVKQNWSLNSSLWWSIMLEKNGLAPSCRLSRFEFPICQLLMTNETIPIRIRHAKWPESNGCTKNLCSVLDSKRVYLKLYRH